VKPSGVAVADVDMPDLLDRIPNRCQPINNPN